AVDYRSCDRLHGREESEKAKETRELLSPLMDIASRYALACVIVRHFTKVVDARAIYRGSGSVDWMAAVRSAFIVVESEDEPGLRILAHVKNSGGDKSPSLGFYIDKMGFRWGEVVDFTPDELLAANRSETRKRQSEQLDGARDLLRSLLVNGPMPSTKIFQKADEAGIAKATVWRAKKAENIKASKERGSGEWWWRLP